MTSPVQAIDTDAVCAILGCRFADASLLETAFTHRSYANGRAGAEDNQRLEFLGDAVLGLLSAEALYRADGDADEGALTERRSALVSGEALAAAATRLDLPKFMRFSPGVRDETERAGSRTAAALMEAVFGAVWLDGGYAAARGLFGRLLGESVDEVAVADPPVDPRGRLQTLTRRLGLGEPAYAILEDRGDGRKDRFLAEARAGDVAATGEGGGKRKAFAAAAAALLERMATGDGQ